MCTKEPANLSCLSLSHASTESDDVMNKQEPCNSCLTHTVYSGTCLAVYVVEKRQHGRWMAGAVGGGAGSKIDLLGSCNT